MAKLKENEIKIAIVALAAKVFGATRELQAMMDELLDERSSTIAQETPTHLSPEEPGMGA